MSRTARPCAGTVSCEFAVVEAEVLGGGHGAGGAELLDLRGHEIAGGAAHGVESLEDVAVVVVDAEDFYRCVGMHVLEVEGEGFGRACGAFGPGVVGAVPVGGA